MKTVWSAAQVSQIYDNIANQSFPLHDLQRGVKTIEGTCCAVEFCDSHVSEGGRQADHVSLLRLLGYCGHPVQTSQGWRLPSSLVRSSIVDTFCTPHHLGQQ